MSTSTIKPAPAKPGAAKPGARFAGRPGAAKGGSTKTRNIIIAVVAALILIVPSSVWAWVHYRSIWRLQKAKAIAAATFSNMDKKTGDQRREAFDDMRQQIDALGLSEAEQRQLRNQGREQFMHRQDEEMSKYLAMSAAERAAYMRQKAAEAAKRFDDRAAKDKNGSGSGSGSSNQARGSGGGPGGRGGNPNGESSAERRSDFRKQMLDNTTPLQRAQRTMYRQDLAAAIGQQNTQRIAQGQPPIPAPGTGGFRGGRGFGR